MFLEILEFEPATYSISDLLRMLFEYLLTDYYMVFFVTLLILLLLDLDYVCMHRTSPGERAATIEMIMYKNACININLGFALLPELLLELLL